MASSLRELRNGFTNCSELNRVIFLPRARSARSSIDQGPAARPCHRRRIFGLEWRRAIRRPGLDHATAGALRSRLQGDQSGATRGKRHRLRLGCGRDAVARWQAVIFVGDANHSSYANDPQYSFLQVHAVRCLAPRIPAAMGATRRVPKWRSVRQNAGFTKCSDRRMAGRIPQFQRPVELRRVQLCRSAMELVADAALFSTPSGHCPTPLPARPTGMRSLSR